MSGREGASALDRTQGSRARTGAAEGWGEDEDELTSKGSGCSPREEESGDTVSTLEGQLDK